MQHSISSNPRNKFHWAYILQGASSRSLGVASCLESKRALRSLLHGLYYSIIDPQANNQVWEEFFNNQLQQQLQQQELPVVEEIVQMQQHTLPVVNKEDLLHSNNTTVSLVSSHSGFQPEERQE